LKWSVAVPLLLAFATACNVGGLTSEELFGSERPSDADSGLPGDSATVEDASGGAEDAAEKEFDAGSELPGDAATALEDAAGGIADAAEVGADAGSGLQGDAATSLEDAAGVAVDAGVIFDAGTAPDGSTSTWLEGVVYDLSTNAPIPAATVSVTGQPSMLAASDGTFRVEGLAPGAVQVSISKRDYWTADEVTTLVVGGNVLPFPLERDCSYVLCPDGWSCFMDFCVLAGGPLLQGTVLDGCTGERIAAKVSYGLAATCSNERNFINYRLMDLPEDELQTFSVEQAGYLSYSASIRLEPSFNTRDVVLQPEGDCGAPRGETCSCLVAGCQGP